MQKIIHNLSATENKDEWLEKKTTLLTSSDSSALFGLSKWCSPYKLWHLKAEKTIENLESKHLFWGQILAPQIAVGVAKLEGLIIEPFNHFIELPDYRIGSSFDFKIIGTTPDSPFRETFEDLGQGILEIKKTNHWAYEKGWSDTEATPYEEIQVQHQMLVSGLKWAVIGGYISGRDDHTTLLRERDVDIHTAIIQRAKGFWVSIEQGNAPEPNYMDDASFIIGRHQYDGGAEHDFTGNEKLTELCKLYHENTQTESNAKKMKDAVKAQVYEIIKDAPKAWGKEWSISAKVTNGTRRFTMKWKG